MDRVFQPLWWRTWRYLQLDVTTEDAPLRLDALRAWFSAYPFDAKAAIHGDIPQLDPLWQTGWRTARLCAHETYMDAPYWEQLQYVGDTRIQALISYVMTGDSRLARQAITNIDDSRTPEGITQSRYPSGLPAVHPALLAAVGEHAPRLLDVCGRSRSGAGNAAPHAHRPRLVRRAPPPRWPPRPHALVGVRRLDRRLSATACRRRMPMAAPRF